MLITKYVIVSIYHSSILNQVYYLIHFFMYAIAVRPSICYSLIVRNNGPSTVYLRQHTEKYVRVNTCFVYLRHYIYNSTQKQQLVYQHASLAQKSLHSLISCNKCHVITSSF